MKLSPFSTRLVHSSGPEAHKRAVVLIERPHVQQIAKIPGEEYKIFLSFSLNAPPHETTIAIIAGARNARGGERACPAEGSEGVIHLFEPVRPVVGF
jgi:adenine C2-methylase RlmN of 23S rRNA A2503 and tRNA A37